MNFLYLDLIEDFKDHIKQGPLFEVIECSSIHS